MKLHLTRPEGRNLFTGYGAGYVAVNDARHQQNIVVSPDGPVQEWAAASFDALTPDDVRALLAFKPEILILGTGERLRFPPPHLMRVVAEASIGFEVMDTKAACRTYNILMAEGRHVVAAIFV
jgi:uncharacterized protein